MVPYYEKYGLEGPNVTGIALTSDFRPELAALKAASPSAKRVGVLHDPRYSAGLVGGGAVGRGAAGPLHRAARGGRRRPRRTRCSPGRKEKVDALLMVADKTVGNAAVVQALIAFAEAQRCRWWRLTSSQVKEGAMLSLAPSSIGDRPAGGSARQPHHPREGRPRRAGGGAARGAGPGRSTSPPPASWEAASDVALELLPVRGEAGLPRQGLRVIPRYSAQGDGLAVDRRGPPAPLARRGAGRAGGHGGRRPRAAGGAGRLPRPRRRLHRGGRRAHRRDRAHHQARRHRLPHLHGGAHRAQRALAAPGHDVLGRARHRRWG